MLYVLAQDVFSYGVVLAEIVTQLLPGRDGFLERHPREKFAVNFEQFRCVFTGVSCKLNVFLSVGHVLQICYCIAALSFQQIRQLA